MGSHSVTCHLTQANAPRLNPSQPACTRFIYPRQMEGWVDLGSLIAAQPGIEPMITWSQVLQALTVMPPKPPRTDLLVHCSLLEIPSIWSCDTECLNCGIKHDEHLFVVSWYDGAWNANGCWTRSSIFRWTQQCCLCWIGHSHRGPSGNCCLANAHSHLDKMMIMWYGRSEIENRRVTGWKSIFDNMSLIVTLFISLCSIHSLWKAYRVKIRTCYCLLQVFKHTGMLSASCWSHEQIMFATFSRGFSTLPHMFSAFPS